MQIEHGRRNLLQWHSIAVNTIWKHSIAMGTIWKHSIAMDTIWKHSIAMGTIWKHSIAMDTIWKPVWLQQVAAPMLQEHLKNLLPIWGVSRPPLFF